MKSANSEKYYIIKCQTDMKEQGVGAFHSTGAPNKLSQRGTLKGYHIEKQEQEIETTDGHRGRW